MTERNHDDENDRRHRERMTPGLTLILLIWIVATLAAYWKAWSCTASNMGGGTARQIANLFLVPLLGPLWWILYYVQHEQGYCVMTK